MRYYEGQDLIVLSKRNLLALLHKLDVPTSARTLISDGFAVQCESDEEHYANREVPGKMSTDTEEFILKHGGLSK